MTEFLGNEDMKSVVEKLYHWRFSGCDSFSASLFELMTKADIINLSRLSKGFPLHVLAFQSWQSAKDENEFFRFFEIERPGAVSEKTDAMEGRR